MSRLDKLAVAVIRWPILWGSLAALGFYALVQKKVLDKVMDPDLVQRYFNSHPVEYISMTLFFIGIAALIVKAHDLWAQFQSVGTITLGPLHPEGQKVAEADALLAQLNTIETPAGENYLLRRLREALEYIQRKGSADDLDEHLRYSADLDAVRMQSSYALMRIIIWAIPILGFLGTVMGITLAIAELRGDELEKSLPGVILGLKVAFDTTALALGLSMVLMFAQFIADRIETQLLGQVDERAAAELTGRFEEFGAATDPQAASVRRMADAVITSTTRLVERQAELWRESLDAAQRQWEASSSATTKHLETSFLAAGQQLEQSLSSSTKKIETSLAGALATGLKQHAAALTEAERQMADQQYKQWRDLQTALLASTEVIRAQQGEMVKQAEMLKQVVEATGQVRSLEQTLNENLTALSASHNFEETVLSLSAAVQLLSTHLHGAAQGPARVELHPKKRSSAPNAA